jgi:hypothetical protein
LGLDEIGLAIVQQLAEFRAAEKHGIDYFLAVSLRNFAQSP